MGYKDGRSGPGARTFMCDRAGCWLHEGTLLMCGAGDGGAEVELWLHLESTCLRLHPSRGSSIDNSHTGYGPAVSLWRALQTLAEGSPLSRAVVLGLCASGRITRRLVKAARARPHL